MKGTPTKSLVIPVYRNAENIEHLLVALTSMGAKLNNELEVVFVVDGSPDNSGELLAAGAPRLAFSTQIVHHSRNFGAFAAIRTGIGYAKGKHIAVMAADLQEPPDLVLQMFNALDRGQADVVFGQRMGRKDGALSGFASRAFWGFYRRFVVRDIPSGGVDIFACTSEVAQSVLMIEEPNGSLITQMFWVGYRRLFIPYNRLERAAGRSGWSFRKRFQYMLDSIFSYSDLPIMIVLWTGVVGFVVSVALGAATVVARLAGQIDENGYTTLVLLVLFFGSLILSVQGVLGCYIWRIAENSKNRPLSIVSSRTEINASE